MNLKPKLLIVDEDPAITMNLKVLLENRNCIVHTAKNAEEALSIIDKNDVNIMITGYKLPGMDGIELIRHSKRIRHDLQCLLTSAYADLQITIKAMKAGAVNFIRKPLKISEFSVAVDEAIDCLQGIRNFRTKILLVEDSTSIRKLELRMLMDTGFHNIVEAVNGEDAIEALEKNSDIGLIISDWNMPKKTGIELLEWLKTNDKFKHIPFIMATAQGAKKQVVEAFDKGANNYVIKPFGRRDLKIALEETLPKRKDIENNEVIPKRWSNKTVSGKTIIEIAHLPITDHIILGALKHLISTGELKPKHFDLKTQRMLLWNPVQRALERGEVDAVFILAPIAMDLFNFGMPIKLLLLTHKNGSICVTNSNIENISKQQDQQQKYFHNKSFYLPHLLSIHHMLSHQYFTKIGMNPGFTDDKDANLFLEVIPPIIMPDFQSKDKDVGGFMVAEPIGTKAIHQKIGQHLFLSSDLWDNHPCCALVMRNDLIEANQDAVQELVNMLVKAGKFVNDEPKIASEMAVSFLDSDKKMGLTSAMLSDVLKNQQNIKTDDLLPNLDDLDRIQQYMYHKMGYGELIDLEKFVDMRFAEIACKG
ncbi:response regulator receiver modulated CheW protein [Candidatus Magnetomorum sp. HK-1]|nr:response regulator receiver modulated CheW protein [Candidatus Magnetomorum sp. HK-1]